jgi:hypothetical protein
MIPPNLTPILSAYPPFHCHSISNTSGNADLSMRWPTASRFHDSSPSAFVPLSLPRPLCTSEYSGDAVVSGWVTTHLMVSDSPRHSCRPSLTGRHQISGFALPARYVTEPRQRGNVLPKEDRSIRNVALRECKKWMSRELLLAGPVPDLEG